MRRSDGVARLGRARGRDGRALSNPGGGGLQRMKSHPFFRAAWSVTNLLLAASLVALIYGAAWEYSTRRYLKGFSDAVVPITAPPEQKIEAILEWMRGGPRRATIAHPDAVDRRDPQTTLNYRQLLSVCGTATNAFTHL